MDYRKSLALTKTTDGGLSLHRNIMGAQQQAAASLSVCPAAELSSNPAPYLSAVSVGSAASPDICWHVPEGESPTNIGITRGTPSVTTLVHS